MARPHEEARTPAYTGTTRSPEVLWGSLLTTLLAMGVVVVFLAPELVGLLPRCTLKTLVGLPCPTCGGTRAAMALALGHPFRALLLNPLAGAGLLASAAYVPYAWLVVFGLIRPLRTGWLSPPMPVVLRWSIGLAIVGNWIYLLAAGR